MSRDWCIAVPDGVRLSLHVAPNAKKSEVTGVLDEALKIRLQAQPIEGKANEALVRFIADALGVPKSAVSITHGLSGKRKILEVHANRLTVEVVTSTLLPSSKF